MLKITILLSKLSGTVALVQTVSLSLFRAFFLNSFQTDNKSATVYSLMGINIFCALLSVILTLALGSH